MGKMVLGVVSFCLLAIIVNSQTPKSHFEIHGFVLCDPCRLQFRTNFTYPLEGVEIQTICMNRENRTTTFTTETKTRDNGFYAVRVPGEHEDDLCEVILKKSPKPECSEIMDTRDRDPISLTENAGISGDIRYANDLLYMTAGEFPECAQIYAELWDEVNEDY